MNLGIGTVERTAFGRKSEGLRFVLSASLGLLFLLAGVCDRASAASDPALLGVFVGSSPGGESISRFLPIPADVEPPIQWQLTLYQDPKSQLPTRYKLQGDFTTESPKALPKGGKKGRTEKEGTWKLAKGTKFNSDAVV